MVKKIMKWFCALVLILMTVTGQMGTALVAEAAKAEDTTKLGIADFEDGEASIEVRGNAGQTLVDKIFYLYRLFDAVNSEDLESIEYTINEDYREALYNLVSEKTEKATDELTDYDIIDYIQSMNTYEVGGAQADQTLESSYSDYRYFVEELVLEIVSTGNHGQVVYVEDTKEDNSIEITGLQYGYYMIVDATVVDGSHTASSMVMTNTANPEAIVNVKSDYPTVTKQIQEDDTSEWNDIGDFEIGQSVPYRYQSVIPNINGYDTYYYAWHDVMDSALTLQENSIQITISGIIDSEEKTYQLTEAEYSLVTGLEEETFMIEISDIKDIIDREFDQIDERDENIYGQMVTVTYNATLNDAAAKDTGRPGFENDVRLEYSNHPSSWGEGMTGFTPWDTVVCFTYKMNGVKVNSNGTVLEGAEFRLYRDLDCTSEVSVKNVEGNYYVMNETTQGAVPMVSAEDGTFNIYGLDSGSYYLKEETAPTGYRALEEPIQIEVKAVFPTERNTYVKGDAAGDEVLKLLATATIRTLVNGEYEEEAIELSADAETGSIQLSVVNETGKKLPITGSYMMPIIISSGVALMCVAMLRERKKHE